MKSKALAENQNQLCPNCETGLKTFLLDRNSSFCPYLACHTGNACAMFEPNLEKRMEDVL